MLGATTRLSGVFRCAVQACMCCSLKCGGSERGFEPGSAVKQPLNDWRCGAHYCMQVLALKLKTVATQTQWWLAAACTHARGALVCCV